MKFKDYNSSYITPQTTLLKKFNELIKWLLENTDMYFANVFEVSQAFSEGNSITRNKIVENENKVCKEGDLLVFNNCFYAFVNAVNETTIYFNEPVDFRYKLYRHKVQLATGTSFGNYRYLVFIDKNSTPCESYSEAISRAKNSLESYVSCSSISTECRGHIIRFDLALEFTKLYGNQGPVTGIDSQVISLSGEDFVSDIVEEF